MNYLFQDFNNDECFKIKIKYFSWLRTVKIIAIILLIKSKF